MVDCLSKRAYRQSSIIHVLPVQVGRVGTRGANGARFSPTPWPEDVLSAFAYLSSAFHTYVFMHI